PRRLASQTDFFASIFCPNEKTATRSRNVMRRIGRGGTGCNRLVRDRPSLVPSPYAKKGRIRARPLVGAVYNTTIGADSLSDCPGSMERGPTPVFCCPALGTSPMKHSG